ncbi:MAG: adenylosuccinate synthetase, partial [Myxococcota bacterium]
YFANVGAQLDQALKADERVLFEGAQGVLLDIDHGTYPYVTSSNTVSSNAATGTGLGPNHLGPVMGVMKAYTTRVGSGPFPTELFDAAAEELRSAGQEFGATTGRPRRCGWLDLVALRYAVRVAGITHLVVTKLDVLAGIRELPVCVAYELDGQRLENYPDNVHDLQRIKPVYEQLRGFEQLGTVEKWSDLPPPAQAYLQYIAEALGVAVAFVSVGPGRGEDLELTDPFN